jgi:hypothetical protein
LWPDRLPKSPVAEIFSWLLCPSSAKLDPPLFLGNKAVVKIGVKIPTSRGNSGIKNAKNSRKEISPRRQQIVMTRSDATPENVEQ